MDPKHLSQLAIIVELGSVTKAARKLNITQPTLSRTVKVIEDRVGGAVLRRGRHGVTPTDIGMRLALEGSEIMRRSEQARSAIQEWKHGLAGELRIGVGPMLSATFMGDFLVNSAKKPPHYVMKIYCEYAARLVERLKTDQLDAAIIPYDLNSNEDSLLREQLFQDQLAVFVGKDDPLAKQNSVKPQALADHQWVSIGEISGLFNSTRETLDILGLSSTVSQLEITGDVHMIFKLLENTKTGSILPFRQLAVFQDRFQITPVDLDMGLAKQNVALWTTMASRDRPEIVDFLNRITRHLTDIGLR